MFNPDEILRSILKTYTGIFGGAEVGQSLKLAGQIPVKQNSP
jgi:hypothetical protein